MTSTCIPIKRAGAWSWLLTLCGAPARWSDIRIDRNRVRVRMGWGFRTWFPRGDVVRVTRARAMVSIGVHGWRGRWLVNGAHRPIAAVELAAPVPARVLGFPVNVRELLVSVDDVTALERALLA
jgi:hypothetical protein